MIERLSHSPEETVKLGKKIGIQLAPNTIICFSGDLGAGKTTLIKGLASSAADCDEEIVNSPTFVYLNIYEGKKTVFHFDLYRLQQPIDFLRMGFDEYLYLGGISCIEWSERLGEHLPSNCLHISLHHLDKDLRKMTISGLGNAEIQL